MPIVLDAMGSDRYPDPEIEGAITAALELGEEIILVGNEEIVRPKLEKANTRNAPVRLVHAPDVLEMTDKPVEGARKKPRNSMAVGMELVKSGGASAFVTAGNTGGANFIALRTLGRIRGVSRPPLTAVFPTRKGFCVVCDIGANVDCRPEFLVEFAVMGSIYAQKMLGIERPRVGLLSNGEEASKGNQLVHDTYPLLEKTRLNFIGNVEGKEIFQGDVDVVVTDGFVGNVMLKSVEAVSKLLIDMLTEQIKSSPITMLGGLLAKPAFRKLKKMMAPDEVGAAPLLGIDGLVFVGHGRSNARAIYSALKLAHQAVQKDLLGALRDAIQQELSSTRPTE